MNKIILNYLFSLRYSSFEHQITALLNNFVQFGSLETSGCPPVKNDKPWALLPSLPGQYFLLSEKRRCIFQHNPADGYTFQYPFLSRSKQVRPQTGRSAPGYYLYRIINEAVLGRWRELDKSQIYSHDHHNRITT